MYVVFNGRSFGPARLVDALSPGSGIGVYLVEGLESSGAQPIQWGDSELLQPDTTLLGMGYVGDDFVSDAVRFLSIDWDPLRDAHVLHVQPGPALGATNPRLGGASGPILNLSGALVAFAFQFGAATEVSPIASRTARAFVEAAMARVSRAPDVGNFVRPLAARWQPQRATLLIEKSDGIVATTLDGTQTPLVALTAARSWQYSPRADALVVAVETAYETIRLAIWDLSKGEVRWLTPEAPRVRHDTPVWSPDGRVVYFREWPASPLDPRSPALMQIASDGTGMTKLYAPPAPLVARPLASTADTLVFALGYEGESISLLDLATRSVRLAGTYSILAGRETAPRFLIEPGIGGIGTPIPTGLMAWEPGDGPSRVLPEDTQVAGAAWESAGTRIVAATHPSRSKEPYALETMDTRGGARTRLVGTEDASRPHWTREGIAFHWSRFSWTESTATGESAWHPEAIGPYEVRLATPAGVRTLMRSDEPLWIRQVVGQ